MEINFYDIADNTAVQKSVFRFVVQIWTKAF